MGYPTEAQFEEARSGRPYRDNGLSFDQVRTANSARCNSGVFGPRLYDWSPTDWACAMAGEAGEACNEIKKLRRQLPGRDEGVTPETIGAELADTVLYADLLAARLGIDLGEAIRKKFNAISVRVGAPQRL